MAAQARSPQWDAYIEITRVRERPPASATLLYRPFVCHGPGDRMDDNNEDQCLEFYMNAPTNTRRPQCRRGHNLMDMSRLGAVYRLADGNLVRYSS